MSSWPEAKTAAAQHVVITEDTLSSGLNDGRTASAAAREANWQFTLLPKTSEVSETSEV
jgi:hypothetical protein